MATWWMGLVIGIIVIPVGLIIPAWKNYLFDYIPDGVTDKLNFCVVGNMHNFSYILRRVS